MSSVNIAKYVRQTYPRAQEARRGLDDIVIIDRESDAVVGMGRTALDAWNNATARIAASLSGDGETSGRAALEDGRGA